MRNNPITMGARSSRGRGHSHPRYMVSGFAASPRPGMTRSSSVEPQRKNPAEAGLKVGTTSPEGPVEPVHGYLTRTPASGSATSNKKAQCRKFAGRIRSSPPERIVMIADFGTPGCGNKPGRSPALFPWRNRTRLPVGRGVPIPGHLGNAPLPEFVLLHLATLGAR